MHCEDPILGPQTVPTFSNALLVGGGNDMFVPFRAIPGASQRPGYSFQGAHRVGLFLGSDGRPWVSLNTGFAFPLEAVEAYAYIIEDLTGTVDGANDIFSTSAPIESGSETVYINGLAQRQGVDYTLSDNIVTLIPAPLVGDYLSIRYRAAQI